MDFHAWFEAWIGGGWHTFDARHNLPRIGRVVVARGRDAVETAFLTNYGIITLTSMRVWAEQATNGNSGTATSDEPTVGTVEAAAWTESPVS
jgi:hypothetical protein